jgi:hypothetical protein
VLFALLIKTELRQHAAAATAAAFSQKEEIKLDE